MRAASVIGRSCALSGEPADQLDHIRPVSRGGTNHPPNLQPLRAECNRVKGDR